MPYDRKLARRKPCAVQRKITPVTTPPATHPLMVAGARKRLKAVLGRGHLGGFAEDVAEVTMVGVTHSLGYFRDGQFRCLK